MLSLFFVPALPESGPVAITGDEAHHAIKVTRMEVGDEILVADGSGAWVKGKVSSVDKKVLTVEPLARGATQKSKPQLIVVQALAKSDRSKEAVELMTAAGADMIIGWEAERSIAKWQDDFLDKWSTTALAACKQSRRFDLPVIEGPIATAEIGKRFGQNAILLIFHESATQSLSAFFENYAEGASDGLPIVCVIGPEGGISEAELVALGGAGGHVVLLGQEVFRSAHAGFAALSAIQALIKRW